MTFRSATAQGWIQIACAVSVIAGGGLMGFSHLEAKADKAIEHADDAKTIALDVRAAATATKDELIKSLAAVASDVRNIQTILNERLPAKPAKGD